jgi:type II secretory pathway component PulF
MNITATESSSTNVLLWAMTTMTTFVTDNWYLIIMVIFGFVHVLVVWQRDRREKYKFKLEIELLEKKKEQSV